MDCEAYSFIIIIVNCEIVLKEGRSKNISIAKGFILMGKDTEYTLARKTEFFTIKEIGLRFNTEVFQ